MDLSSSRSSPQLEMDEDEARPPTSLSSSEIFRSLVLFMLPHAILLPATAVGVMDGLPIYLHLGIQLIRGRKSHRTTRLFSRSIRFVP
jgi:hypothetical protein